MTFDELYSEFSAQLINDSEAAGQPELVTDDENEWIRPYAVIARRVAIRQVKGLVFSKASAMKKRGEWGDEHDERFARLIESVDTAAAKHDDARWWLDHEDDINHVITREAAELCQ